MFTSSIAHLYIAVVSCQGPEGTVAIAGGRLAAAATAGQNMAMKEIASSAEIYLPQPAGIQEFVRGSAARIRRLNPSFASASPILKEAEETGKSGLLILEKITSETFNPDFHFHSSSWMNDPAGLFYNSFTQEYHFYFQMNPHDFNWGSMNWGLATTKDLVNFQYRGIAKAPLGDQSISIAGSQALVDENHVFTGMVVPSGVDGRLTSFYTSVDFKKAELFGWSKPKYLRAENQERVAVAFSEDNGLTWSNRKIIIPDAPTNYDVIGWRDPFVFQDDALVHALQQAGRSEITKDSWFMILGSGERNVGGRVPLYTSSNMLDWKYEEKALLSVPGQTETSWKPSFGWNFETVSKLTLPSAINPSENHNVFLIGTEGYRHNNAEGQAPMWTAGIFKPELETKSVSMERQVSGPLDHGQYYYAPGLLKDTKNKNRMLVSGWIKEEKAIAAKQKWSGVLSVTRQLEMTSIKNVVVRNPEETLSLLPDRGYLVHEIASPLALDRGAKIVTLETLGIKPIPELTSGSLAGTKIASLSSQSLEGPASRIMTSAKSTSFHVNAKFKIDAKTNPIVGLTLRSTPDGAQETLVLYDHQAKLLKVHRPSMPGSPEDAAPFTEQGEFELFEVLGKDGKSIEREEMDLSVFVDNSVVEVFANGRFALSTRIYPTAPDANGIGVVGRQGSATLVDVTVQDFKKLGAT